MAKKRNVLMEIVDGLLNSNSENRFYYLISQIQRGGTGKSYVKNSLKHHLTYFKTRILSTPN